jgi:hypothetical protein
MMTVAAYIVVYPHPSIPPVERIQRLELESGDDGKQLLELLRGIFPDHSSDLKDATLWKVSRSSAAQLPP